MPRRTTEGKFILSAGEIGAYTVCPEAWRLQYVEKKGVEGSVSVKEGRIQHEDWHALLEEGISIQRYATRVLNVVLITLVFILLLLGTK